MLAAAGFNQYSGAEFAVSHARLLRAVGRLPHRPLHRGLLAASWLETWLRWPLKTLNILDRVDATFSALDPDGRRFGLTKQVRDGFRKNLLYHQVPDLLTLLAHLDKPGARQRLLRVENREVLERETAGGPGAIVAGFRIGAYPVVPWALASLGYPVSMIVGTEQLAGAGRSLGREFIPRLAERVRFFQAKDPLVLASCLNDLNAGGVACTLAELSPIEFAKTTEVQFLDWRIQVPYGIAYLSAMTKRNVIPAILTREPGPRFRLRFGEPLPAPARDSASIRAATQELYRALERRVLQFPEQWIGWTLLGSHMGIELDSTPQTAPAIF
jgi:hypothetical protein